MFQREGDMRGAIEEGECLAEMLSVKWKGSFQTAVRRAIMRKGNVILMN
jgi:hypothetical protein